MTISDIRRFLSKEDAEKYDYYCKIGYGEEEALVMSIYSYDDTDVARAISSSKKGDFCKAMTEFLIKGAESFEKNDRFDEFRINPSELLKEYTAYIGRKDRLSRSADS